MGANYEAEYRMVKACAKAVALWGRASQFRMLQEECGEVVAAVNQFDRGRLSPDDLASEIADLVIMVGQARLILGTLVDEAVLMKLTRLEERIRDAEAGASAR